MNRKKGKRSADRSIRQRQPDDRALLDSIPDALIRVARSADGLQFATARRTTGNLDPSSDLESPHLSLPPQVVVQFERHFDLARMGVTASFQYQLESEIESRSFEARIVPYRDDEVLAVIRDVTAQKETERQILESHRLEALGRLAGGVSHDFNNLLTVIAGSAELAVGKCQAAGHSPVEIEEIITAAERAGELIRQLLAFSRRQQVEPKPIDLNHVLAVMERMLVRLIGEDIELEVLLGQGPSTILADPGQLEQVLLNLAANARDAMPEGGTLTFETQACELHQTHVGLDLRIPAGRYLRLTVSDTGVGIDPDARAHIFEPFFTTKSTGKGTGLGLSTVYGIVKQTGGHIYVYSEPGGGTTFRIYFPRAEPVALDAPAPEAVAEALPSGGSGEAVLLVEDDAGVLELARAILKRGGYSVISAPSGPRAMEVAARFRDEIALLVTDVVMPGMTGRQLATELAAVRPGLKVLYMSGYAERTVERYGVRSQGAQFLEKPFSSATLLHAVRRAIDAQLHGST